MAFIKSYWWVFALLIGAFLLYWFMFRTPAKTPIMGPKPKANPACPLSVEQWDAEVARVIGLIEGNNDWLAAVTAQVNPSNPQMATLALSKRANAIYQLESEGVCNPTKAPVA